MAADPDLDVPAEEPREPPQPQVPPQPEPDPVEEEKRRREAEFALLNKEICLLYTSPSPRDKRQSRMPSSA